jgi:sugar-specific transcriptional regulator TrmB
MESAVSGEESSSSVGHLSRLGLNTNEAKALDALIALGPAGASDVHRFANVPRNKAYESLERLATRGIVEVQKGRPTLYRAIGAKGVIDHLLESYQKEARQALNVLEKKQEEARGDAVESDGTEAYAWMVRGELGAKRRLAELIYSAKSDFFAIGAYPPKYLLAVRSALKAAAKRGVNVRPVCMVRPTLSRNDLSPESERSIIEYRTIKSLQTIEQRMQPYDEKIMMGFRGTSGVGGMVIIDEEIAFDILDPGKDPRKVSGLLIKAPGIPRIQKATAERILTLYTRKL